MRVLLVSGAKRQQFNLEDGLTVGRAGQIRLPTDPLYSRIHATFSFLGGRWHISDGNGGPSVQGVYVNRSPSRIKAPHPLRDGDRIFFLPGIFRRTYLVYLESGADETVSLLPFWERIQKLLLPLQKAARFLLASYRVWLVVIGLLAGVAAADGGAIVKAFMEMVGQWTGQ